MAFATCGYEHGIDGFRTAANDFGRLIREDAPRVQEPHASSVATDERHSKASLQIADRTLYGGHTEIEGLCRATKMLRLCERNKNFELVKAQRLNHSAVRCAARNAYSSDRLA